MFRSVVLSASTFTAVFLFVLSGPQLKRQLLPWLHEWGERTYSHELRALFITGWTARTMLYVSFVGIVLAFGLGAFVTHSVLAASVIAGAVAYMPRLVLRMLKARRLEQCEAQIVAALELLANAVKSGMTLPQALALVATQLPPPLAQEFALIVQEYEVDLPLDQAIRNLLTRVPSKNLGLAIAALLVSRTHGGDLPQTLARIRASIEEIARLEERIRISTAEGRKSARTMALMPFVLGFMLYLMDPNSFLLLFIDPLGNLLLCGAVVLMVLAYLWIKRIVNISV